MVHSFLFFSPLANRQATLNRKPTCRTLRLYSRVPPNGLVIYCGTIVTDEGKEKRMNLDFEPFKAINTSLYLCDNKFHTEVGGVTRLLQVDRSLSLLVGSLVFSKDPGAIESGS